MLITLLIYTFFSNAVTSRRDKSILFSRVVIVGLLLIGFIAFNSLYIKPLENGVGIYNGLFNVTTYTQTFNIFIVLMRALILVLTSFFPRRVFLQKHSNLYEFLSSSLSSCFILFGSAILYANSGTTSLERYISEEWFNIVILLSNNNSV